MIAAKGMNSKAVAGWRAGLWPVVAAVILICGMMQAQQQTTPTNGGQIAGRPMRSPSGDIDQNSAAIGIGSPVFQERRIRQLNLAQHKAMVSDTDKLLKLVTELNAEINASSSAELTPDQLRKVAEIEKLAHSVKDKMRTTTQGSPEFLDAAPPLPQAPSRR